MYRKPKTFIRKLRTNSQLQLKLVKRPDDRREESATWLEGVAIESREKKRISWNKLKGKLFIVNYVSNFRMQYKAIIIDNGNFYEATSYYRRQNNSESWKRLGKLEENSLEETVLNATLKIAHERMLHTTKKKTKVIVELE